MSIVLHEDGILSNKFSGKRDICSENEGRKNVASLKNKDRTTDSEQVFHQQIASKNDDVITVDSDQTANPGDVTNNKAALELNDLVYEMYNNYSSGDEYEDKILSHTQQDNSILPIKPDEINVKDEISSDKQFKRALYRSIARSFDDYLISKEINNLLEDKSEEKDDTQKQPLAESKTISSLKLNTRPISCTSTKTGATTISDMFDGGTTNSTTNGGASSRSPIIKSGWIVKSAKKMGRWKKRWAVLQYGVLTYYVTSAMKRLKGRVNLRVINLRTTAGSVINSTPTPFHFQMVDKTLRVWTFCFDTDLEMIEWFDNISNAAGYHSTDLYGTMRFTRDSNSTATTTTTTATTATTDPATTTSTAYPTLSNAISSINCDNNNENYQKRRKKLGKKRSFVSKLSFRRKTINLDQLTRLGSIVPDAASQNSTKTRNRSSTTRKFLESDLNNGIRGDDTSSSSSCIKTNISKSGYVYKGNKHGKKFQKRWFSIDKYRFTYFDDYLAALDGLSRGSIGIGEIESCSSCIVEKDSSISYNKTGERLHEFMIQTNRRPYIFGTVDKTSMNSWVDTINQVLKSLKINTDNTD